jgi:hypothetical protein
MVTSKDPRNASQTCLLAHRFFYRHGFYIHRDWGNAHLVEVAQRIADWPCYVNVSTAGGFFKAVMRRSNDDEYGWCWALEWNKFVRVIGSISPPDQIPKVFDDLPNIGWVMMPGHDMRMRQEKPIDPSLDFLFPS